MKVSISLFGKFHAFYMAKALHKANHLNKIITSYPKFLVTPKIPNRNINSLFVYELFSRFLRFLQKLKIINLDINTFISNLYSKKAAKKIGFDNDIVVSWSSKSLEIFEKLDITKTIKILERGSTHALFQREILKEEYKILGLTEPKFLNNADLIAKQLKEYDLADYISVPSQFVKKSFVDNGVNKEKIIVINYGIDENQFPKIEKIKKRDKFVVLYVGSTEVRKGIHYLLDAIKLLDEENIELHIVGEISEFFKSILPTNKKSSYLVI